MIEAPIEARLGDFKHIVGVDEAGRGPLAGPVVVAAVMLGPTGISGLDDSKKLTARARESAFTAIIQEALAWRVECAHPREIDSKNILRATLAAMHRAVTALPLKPDICLVDGNIEIPDLPCAQETMVNGDGKSVSIAAASILAKVVRDRLMTGFHLLFPQFGFARHKGYPTSAHRSVLEAYGPTAIHRHSFSTVARVQVLHQLEVP